MYNFKNKKEFMKDLKTYIRLYQNNKLKINLIILKKLRDKYPTIVIKFWRNYLFISNI